MEGNNSSQAEDIGIPPQSTPVIPPVLSQTPIQPTQKTSKKSNKLILVALIIVGFLGLLLILAAPVMKILNINPEAKFAEATLKACNEKCAGSDSLSCVNKCMEDSGPRGMVTPIKITPTPSPSAIPSPAVSAKLTYKPKVTPTPVAPAPLIIKITLPKKNITEQTKVVTIVNQKTGESFTRSGEGYISVYNVTTNTYKVSVNDVPDHKTANASCDQNCGPGNFSYGNDRWGNSREINVDIKTSRGVSFSWVENSVVPTCKGGIDSPFCL